MESFFHTLKTVHVHHQDHETRAAAKPVLFGDIEVFYNRHRGHSYLGHRSPAEFEAEGYPLLLNLMSAKSGKDQTTSRVSLRPLRLCGRRFFVQPASQKWS
jgi:hypothetical protein